MKNGKFTDAVNIDVTNKSGADVASGGGLLVGTALFGYAMGDIADDADGIIVTEGGLNVAALSTDVIAVGDVLNWNDTNKNLQKATSDLDGVAVAIGTKAATVTLVDIKLTP